MRKLNLLFCVWAVNFATFNYVTAGFGGFPGGNIKTGFNDFVEAGKESVQKDIKENLLTPENFFELGKQGFLGYPYAAASSAINEFCSRALLAPVTKPRYVPDISKLKFQMHTPCGTYDFPLHATENFWKSMHFDPEKNVVILASGFNLNPIASNGIIQTMSKAFLCRNDTNFISIDTAEFVNTLYLWSSFDTEKIGEEIAKSLTAMYNYHKNDRKIHLIGHSLAAHIVGSAARNFFDKTDKMIPHITGLDPAKPCFNEGESLGGLARGDADFIDVIHSNSGVLGRRDPTGDVDFYPGGAVPLPPGCVDVFCAHDRSWQYYAESVYKDNKQNFMSWRCNSLLKLHGGKCQGVQFPMGYAVPLDLKGNYYLDVLESEPFGKNATVAKHDCAICKKE